MNGDSENLDYTFVVLQVNMSDVFKLCHLFLHIIIVYIKRSHVPQQMYRG